MDGELGNKNEGVKIFYDEYCRENEEGEWSIVSKIGGLDFYVNGK